jgi:hypothetical protein
MALILGSSKGWMSFLKTMQMTGLSRSSGPEHDQSSGVEHVLLHRDRLAPLKTYGCPDQHVLANFCTFLQYWGVVVAW